MEPPPTSKTILSVPIFFSPSPSPSHCLNCIYILLFIYVYMCSCDCLLSRSKTLICFRLYKTGDVEIYSLCFLDLQETCSGVLRRELEHSSNDILAVNSCLPFIYFHIYSYFNGLFCCNMLHSCVCVRACAYIYRG